MITTTERSNIEFPSSSWSTPVPLFYVWTKDKSLGHGRDGESLPRRKQSAILRNRRPLILPSVTTSKFTSSSSDFKRIKTYPQQLPQMRRRIDISGRQVSNHGTSTVPIPVETQGTQTIDEAEDEISEIDDPKTQFPRGESIDRSTSPLFPGIQVSTTPAPPSSHLLNDLQNLRGMILIQKFVTRTEQEFQELVKVRLPRLLVPPPAPPSPPATSKLEHDLLELPLLSSSSSSSLFNKKEINLVKSNLMPTSEDNQVNEKNKKTPNIEIKLFQESSNDSIQRQHDTDYISQTEDEISRDQITIVSSAQQLTMDLRESVVEQVEIVDKLPDNLDLVDDIESQIIPLSDGGQEDMDNKENEILESNGEFQIISCQPEMDNEINQALDNETLCISIVQPDQPYNKDTNDSQKDSTTVTIELIDQNGASEESRGLPIMSTNVEEIPETGVSANNVIHDDTSIVTFLHDAGRDDKAESRIETDPTDLPLQESDKTTIPDQNRELPSSAHFQMRELEHGSRDSDSTVVTDDETSIISVIPSPRFGDDDILECECQEEPIAITMLKGNEAFVPPIEVRSLTKSTGIQTEDEDERSSLVDDEDDDGRSDGSHRSSATLSSAGTATTSHSSTVLDLSLRIEKVDVRLRLAGISKTGNKQRRHKTKLNQNASSEPLLEDRPNITILEVKGQRIKLHTESSKSLLNPSLPHQKVGTQEIHIPQE